jgi:poly(beta-D-mannuronate) C5 epimerase
MMFSHLLPLPVAKLAVIPVCSFIGFLVSIFLLLSFSNFAYSQFSLFSSQWTHESASPPPYSSFQSAAFAVPIKEIKDAISSPSSSTTSAPSCILYDPSNRTITVSCSSARLSDVYNQLHDNSILTKQSPLGIWFLNANLVIAKGATLHVDFTDTKWLKINSKATSDSSSKSSSSSHSRSSYSYIIDVLGALKINSVKITSWDPTTNNYAITNGSRHGDTKHAGDPRPHIKVEKEASGTTDIKNSEIAYLGYEKGSISGAGTDGLNYYGGDGSIIKNNNIHDLYFGLYTFGVGHMIVENNTVRNSGHYGLDPHTGTHDMIIRNNTVHGNGGIGIICSLDCYNILIENNKVHDNAASGIMFSRNMTNSIARNNIVYNEDNGIFVSQSSNNQIYKNIISNSTNGINVGSDSSVNKIYNNTIIKSSSHGIAVSSRDAAANTIYSNIIK